MAHHRAGLARAIGDALTDVPAFMDALEAHGRGEGPLPEVATQRERAILSYALALTHRPATMTRADLEPLRAAGLDDGEILDTNQVAAYYAYANRLVDGLGVELEEPPEGR